jgi:hypothetical protein
MNAIGLNVIGLNIVGLNVVGLNTIGLNVVAPPAIHFIFLPDFPPERPRRNECQDLQGVT